MPPLWYGAVHSLSLVWGVKALTACVCREVILACAVRVAVATLRFLKTDAVYHVYGAVALHARHAASNTFQYPWARCYYSVPPPPGAGFFTSTLRWTGQYTSRSR